MKIQNSLLNNLTRRETQRELTYISKSLAGAVIAMQAVIKTLYRNTANGLSVCAFLA
jgi:hypothetical protein